ncbi:MAG: tetratricopeptide repeat protein [Bacteroidales bacterium]|nr:tetratricopeptide repeat protein [Bacteroidales bacterium]
MLEIAERERGKIYKSLSEGLVYKAIKQIEYLFEEAIEPTPLLVEKVNEVKSIYSKMTQYIASEDPQRGDIYNKLIITLYEVVDETIDIFILNNLVSSYMYDKRRYYNSIGGADIDKEIVFLKEELKNSITTESLKTIENLQNEIFNIIATSFAVKAKDKDAIYALLNTDEFGVVTSSLVVSALTISSIYYYSEDKLLLLLDAYSKSNNEEVKQRALCGALIVMYIHSKKVNLSKGLKLKVETLSAENNFCDDVRFIFLQFIRSIGIEEVSRTYTQKITELATELNDELLSTIKGRNIEDLKDLESLLEQNPKWLKNLEDSEFEKKLRVVNNLQLEGSDLLISAFSGKKEFPFFKSIQNWLRPYTNEYSEIYEGIKENSKLGDILEKTFFLCNSDRYSLLFSSNLNNLQDLMLTGLPSELNMSDMFEDSIEPSRAEAKLRARLYIQDLYRLFTLSKFNLPKIFSSHINLYEVDALKPIFQDGETLRNIAEFYLSKGHYAYAKTYFKLLSDNNPTDYLLYQKIGYCNQMLKDYKGAIKEYEKADIITRDVWTITSIALCYRLTGDTAKAIEYYKEAQKLEPDNVSFEMQIGYTLLMSNKYKEALDLFYKVDFVTDGTPKTWRAIAWCSLLLGKFDDAQQYYEKVLSESPTSNDYINMGHIYLIKNDINNAQTYYAKSIEMSSYNTENFEDSISKDKDILLNFGVSDIKISILRDIIINNTVSKKNTY